MVHVSALPPVLFVMEAYMVPAARLDTQTIFSDAAGNGFEVSFEPLLHNKCGRTEVSGKNLLIQVALEPTLYPLAPGPRLCDYKAVTCAGSTI
jgi:hypothetical protein